MWDPEPLDLAAMGRLDFHHVDEKRYPCFRLAREALSAGGVMPAVLNAANEVAVDAFLNGEIAFTGIAGIVSDCLDNAPQGDVDTLGRCWISIFKPVNSRGRCALDTTGRTAKLTMAGDFAACRNQSGSETAPQCRTSALHNSSSAFCCF